MPGGPFSALFCDLYGFHALCLMLMVEAGCYQDRKDFVLFPEIPVFSATPRLRIVSFSLPFSVSSAPLWRSSFAFLCDLCERFPLFLVYF